MPNNVDQFQLTLRKVRHVPNIKLNLISTGRMDDEGYNGSFRNGKWKICKGNLIVARAQKQGTMYVMHAKLCKYEANGAADSSGEIWHKRLGHMSEKGMHILTNQILLPEVKRVHLERCVSCLVGKQQRAAFHSRPPRRREDALELIHTDVHFVDAPSHRGRQYFVTFTVDYSRKLLAFVLKSKDQVLSFFKEFQVIAERCQVRR